MKQRMFHTPEGVRDVYNGECEKKQYLTEELSKVIHGYGYQDIETPSFEYFDVFSREVGTTPSKDLYKFFDREGNTLVLRPDFTPSIARAAAKYFLADGFPVRLCYKGSTFINNTSYQGRLKESTEMGVELMGDPSIDADAEILSLTIELLKKTGLTEFQISVGQVDYFKALVEEAQMTEEMVAELRDLISNKNYFGVETLIAQLQLDEKLEMAFSRLPSLFGSIEVLKEAKELACNARGIEAINRLEKIYDILRIYGVEKYVSFDLSMLSQYQYYTGIIFQGYTYGSGEPLIKGGRYDKLLEHFMRPAPAIGFALVMEQVMNALNRQNIEIPVERKKVLILYHELLREKAITLANMYRLEGIRAACMICFDNEALNEKVDCAKQYGYDKILLLEDEDTTLTIE